MISSRELNLSGICFRLHEEDVTLETCDKLFTFALERKMDHCLMSYDGDVTLKGHSRLHLNSGMTTLQKKLGLKYEPIHLKEFKPVPDGFLKYKFPNGYVDEKVMRKVGHKFEEAAINALVTKEKNKFRNSHILQSSTQNLIRDGTITVDSAKRIEDNKKFIEKLQKETDRNPDLEIGEFYVTLFQHGKYDRVSKQFISLSHKVYKLSINSAKEDKLAKQKHYWIYSDGPNYGKTYNLKIFAEKYNAEFVSDLNNWMGVPNNVQFLIFDEYGGKRRLLDFNDFRALTSGYSPSVAFNCKSYGESYIPRKDVQVIVLSNSSPYEVYGSFDNKLQRKFTDKDTIDLIQERFEVFKIGGDVQSDIKKFKHVTEWSGEEFAEEITLKRKEMMKNKDKLVETENFLKKVETMYRMREGETGVSLAGFQKYISDPNDWKVAQWMYSRRLKLIPEDKRKDFSELFLSGESTFILEDVSQLEDIEKALLRNDSLQLIHLFNFLDMNMTNFDTSDFRNACENKFIDIDSDELLTVVVNCFLGVKKPLHKKFKRKRTEISSSSSDDSSDSDEREKNKKN